MKNQSTRFFIWTLAGGYLVYLGFKLLREGVLSGEMTGGLRIFGWISSIAFMAFGAGLMILTLRLWKRMSDQEKEEENAGEEQEGSTQQDARIPQQEAAPKSMFDRARVPMDEEEELPEEETAD